MEAPIMLLSGHSGEVQMSYFLLLNELQLISHNIVFFCKIDLWVAKAGASIKSNLQVYTGKFHPGGDILASSGFDRQIFLWKVYGE